jgi:predicted SprT family Zn-dependent metalloprotease
MDQHGLTAWKIIWTRAKRTHGRCNYTARTLEFSSVAFAHIGEAEVRDTILHEIAHALAGHAAAHGYRWQTICRQIGGSGMQYVSKEAAAALPTTWEGRCPKGHVGIQSYRAPLRVKACTKCSNGRGFQPEYIFAMYHNGRRVNLGQMPVRYAKEIMALRARYGDRLAI